MTDLDEAGIADQLFGIHHIHQRLLDGHLFDAGHVKAVHILPPYQKEKKSKYMASAKIQELLLRDSWGSNILANF